MTLTEFLLARITEDDKQAYFAWPRPPMTSERLRAECEAKRVIVRICDDLLRSFNHEPTAPWPDVNRRERQHASVILESLALPYAEHPDYREEWAI